MRRQSTHLVALVVLVSLAAGCLAGGPVAPQTETDTATATPTEPATATPTQTPWSHTHAADQPDPDKEIRLSNRWNRSVAMHVRVVREATNATVHDATHDIAPGGEQTVYTTAAADPEGVEAFTVTVSARNATESVTIETSACYGNAYGEIREDGSLYVYYAIC
jgi:hypothetical protein